MTDLTLRFEFIPEYWGKCDDCGEQADTDGQTILMKVNDAPALHLHYVCAWKRATFAFWELF